MSEDKMKNALNQILYRRMSQEYDAFIEKLKHCTPEEIIKASYEKVFKEVRCCQLNDCPLYPYKMGKRPKVDTNSNISEKSGS